MKYEHFSIMCAGATAVVIGGSATAALAHQQGQTTTIVGERAGGDQGNSVGVSYRDLNLAAARDEQILHRRIKGAVRSVCDPDAAYLIKKTFAECASFAWAGAQPQVELAVRRAREIASTGTSSIPWVAIAVVGR